MYRVKAQYLGGHPDALSPARKVIVDLGPTGLTCRQPRFEVSATQVLAAATIDPAAPPSDYRWSPTAGIFGGFKANKSETTELMQQQDRTVVVLYRDDQGRDHEVRFGKVTLDGRPRNETKADFATGDWNGARRMVNYLLSIRGRPASLAATGPPAPVSAPPPQADAQAAGAESSRPDLVAPERPDNVEAGLSMTKPQFLGRDLNLSHPAVLVLIGCAVALILEIL